MKVGVKLIMRRNDHIGVHKVDYLMILGIHLLVGGYIQKKKEQ